MQDMLQWLQDTQAVRFEQATTYRSIYPDSMIDEFDDTRHMDHKESWMNSVIYPFPVSDKAR